MRFASPRQLCCCLPFLFTFSLCMYGQSLQFTREAISIALDDSSATVVGRYWFENSDAFPVRRPLFYPFAADSSSIDSVSVSGDCCPAHWSRTVNGLSITLEILPRTTVVLNVRYRESTPERTLRYILTSTASWGHPLRRARYNVYVPQHLIMRDLSLDHAVSSAVPGGTMYRVDRTMFSPDRDLAVRWASRHE